MSPQRRHKTARAHSSPNTLQVTKGIVDLYSGTLESVTDIMLLGGANALAVETGPGAWETHRTGRLVPGTM